MMKVLISMACASSPGGKILERRVLIIEDHQGSLIRERPEAEGMKIAEVVTAQAGLQKAVRSHSEALGG